MVDSPLNSPLIDHIWRHGASIILFLESDGTISNANDYARELMEDPVGKPIADLFLNFDGSFQLSNVLANGDLPHLLHIPTNSGFAQTFYFRFIKAGTGILVVGEVNNREVEELRITLVETNNRANTLTRELHKKNAELDRARKKADAATQTKSEFLAHMSHEIRTPMNAVMGLAQLMEKEPLLPDQLYMVRNIRTAGNSLLGILNDILDFSKIEAGQLRIVQRPFFLPPLLEQLQTLQGNMARSKGITLRVEASSEVTGGVVGDDLRLEQILSNLVGNAIKFTQQGEVLISAQAVESSPEMMRLRFEIRDSGVGMAPEVLSSLFTPFTQANDGITRRFGGTGLGLSICKRLTELMEGTIGVTSREGIGSTFWFELPFHRTTEEVAKQEKQRQQSVPTGPRLKGLRILVVDDSELNRIVLLRALALEGAESKWAANGQQAIDFLKASPPKFDLVIMDMQMPVMDGLLATGILRGELGLTELPVIAFTAGILPGERQKALDAGVNDFMTKPIELEEMVAVILRCSPPPLADEEALMVPAPDENSTADSAAVPLPLTPEELPGLNMVKGISNLGGDREFYGEIIGEMARIHGDDATKIRAAVAADDFQLGARIAHTLMGVARNLAANNIYGSARELEAELRDERRDRLDRLHLRLEEALKELRANALLLKEDPAGTRESLSS